MRRLISLVGLLMLAMGALELGFVLSVAGVLTRNVFIGWSGGWCVVLMIVGAAALVGGEGR